MDDSNDSSVTHDNEDSTVFLLSRLWFLVLLNKSQQLWQYHVVKHVAQCTEATALLSVNYL